MPCNLPQANSPEALSNHGPAGTSRGSGFKWGLSNRAAAASPPEQEPFRPTGHRVAARNRQQRTLQGCAFAIAIAHATAGSELGPRKDPAVPSPLERIISVGRSRRCCCRSLIERAVAAVIGRPTSRFLSRGRCVQYQIQFLLRPTSCSTPGGGALQRAKLLGCRRIASAKPHLAGAAFTTGDEGGQPGSDQQRKRVSRLPGAPRSAMGAVGFPPALLHVPTVGARAPLALAGCCLQGPPPSPPSGGSLQLAPHTRRAAAAGPSQSAGT